jgi:hypothetical protein
MYEFVAILAGVPVALLVRQIDNQRLRADAVIALSLAIGFAVAALAGELSENIGFGFFSDPRPITPAFPAPLDRWADCPYSFFVH